MKFLLKTFMHVGRLPTVKLQVLEFLKNHKRIKKSISVFTFGENFQEV